MNSIEPQSLNRAFPILDASLESTVTQEEFQFLIKSLAELKLIPSILEAIWSSIELYLRRYAVPDFWRKFTSQTEEMKGFELFKCAVDDLYGTLYRFAPQLERMELLYSISPVKRSIYGENNVISGFKQIVKATLLAQLRLDFQSVVHDFYKISFNVFCFANDYDQCDMGDDLPKCGGCGNERENECHQCDYIIQVFHETNRKLMDLQILERLTGQVLTNLIQVRIENHVQETCKGTFDVSHIAALEGWLDTTVMSWLTRIYCAGSAKPPINDPFIKDTIEKFKQKLNCFLYETYTRIRIDQLFNIIIEYPDSQPAIDDIKVCLDKTELRGLLMHKLQVALETRLLHPGVNTPDILTAYVAAIRALRHLDPSGVLLVIVTQPIRNYLRTRDDTVRSVVSSLTEDGPGCELAEELARVSGDEVIQNIAGNEEEVPWDKWCPDPVDADPNTSSRYHRSSDIISMLVNVYGSKELFVNEYRTLLADRLLAQGICNAEKERRYLELLKIRFGESQLHFCEVMLKDISDSKRINGLIQQDPKFKNATKNFSSNAMILSAQFWPPFKDETLELPAVIKEQLELYTKSFEELKGNRTLCWKPHLGTVNVEIEIGSKKMDLSVSPMHATIIMHFQDKSEWYLDDLSQAMKVTATVLRRKMTYWQSMGLITVTSGDKYMLVKDDESGSKHHTMPAKKSQEMICEEEDESPMASVLDQREGELQVFWAYIVGMLTNLDSMPLERIHQMLKMFASQRPDTECSLQELRHFLETKVRNHQLILQGGLYKLPKP